MRIQKYLFLGIIALILSLMITEVDSRRSGGSRSSSSSWGRSSSRSSGGGWFGRGSSSRSSSSYSGGNYYNHYNGSTRSRDTKGLIWGKTNYYSGLVVIPVAGGGGTYYQGYGRECPTGCAVHGRCGTTDECSTSAWWYVLDFFTIVIALIVCCIIEKFRD